MKKLILFLILLSSCTVVFFDNIQNYRGAVILSMKRDSVGSIRVERIIIKPPTGGFETLTIRPEYADFLSVGDTL